MMEPRAAPPIDLDPPHFRFADVVVDTHARQVTRDGDVLPLEPKTYAVLLVLLRKPGELVTREQLLDEVWGHRHVTPGVLTRAIAQLRHALGDDSHAPRFIRTRHALGYCFIGEMHAPAADAADVLKPVGAVEHDEASLPVRAEAEGDANARRFGRRATDPEAVALVAPAPAGTATPAAPAAQPPRLGLRQAWFLGGVLLLLLVVIAARTQGDGHAAMSPASASIAVLPFAGVGAAGDEAWFAEGLSVEMHDALAGVPGMTVVAARGIESTDRDARRIGRRLGVAHVLDARVRRDGGRVRIDAWLTDTRDGRTRWSGRFDRDSANLFALQTEVAEEVVRTLRGRLPAGRAGVARRLQPTSSIAAYDAYLQGMRFLAAGGAEGPRRAVAAFARALSFDPAFARAQAGLCRAEIARFEDGLNADAFDRADGACVQASAMAPDLREVDLALGELYRTRGDQARAIAHYTRALDDVALRAAAYVGLARSHAARRDRSASARHFATALRLQPNDASIHRELGFQRYLDGDLRGAIAAYARATELAPGDERLWSSLGGLQLAAGDAASARVAFERSLAIRPSYAALSNYGSLLYEARDYVRASALYRQAAALDPSDFRTWGNLGDAVSAGFGQSPEARRAYTRAAALAERYVAIRGDDAQAFALLGWYQANLGDGSRARSSLARARALGTEPGEVAFLAAQAHALLGETGAARREAVAALAGGIAQPRLEASPVLHPLLPRAIAGR